MYPCFLPGKQADVCGCLWIGGWEGKGFLIDQETVSIGQLDEILVHDPGHSLDLGVPASLYPQILK